MIKKIKNNLFKFEGDLNRGSKILDDFFPRATPKWFTFLGWLFELGGLTYVFKQTQSTLIIVILIISYGLTLKFFDFHLTNNYFMKWIKKKHPLLFFVLNIIVMFIVLILIIFIIQISINELSIK